MEVVTGISLVLPATSLLAHEARTFRGSRPLSQKVSMTFCGKAIPTNVSLH